MGYAIAGIIVILAGVLAWLSYKSWRWANVVLAFLIVCAASTFGYLSAYTLKVHDKWRTLANKQTAEIEKEEALKQQKIEGVRDETGRLQNGIRQLTRQVQDLIVSRGQAWFDVKPEKIAADGSAVEVSIDAPEPHGVPPQSIVFVFEADPTSDGAAYLGEFVATDVVDKTVKLKPNLPLTARQVEQLKGTKGLWTIFLKMPADENSVFALLTDEQAEAMLPKDVDEAYRKGTRNEDQMSDWVYLFHNFALQRELLADEMVKLNDRITRLAGAEDRNQQKITDSTQEKADLEVDNEGFVTELNTVKKYADMLDAKAKKLAAETSALRAQNTKLAAELKALQLKAAELINQRTETAQASP